jgi:hypothetical protein
MAPGTTLKIAQAQSHKQAGILRTSVAIRLGVQPRTLYAMRDSGLLEQVDRGLYPTILDLPAPHLRGYGRDSTVAEK